MDKYKIFLLNLCSIENITAKDLMKLTGKSQSVVYGWLSFKKSDFPTIDSLGKILFRLGISFDDFINFKHPIYDNGEAARTYYFYIYGYADQMYIGSNILELPNAEQVIKTYIHDRMCLQKMIEEYVNGADIDEDRFDLLSKALMTVVSDFTDYEESIYHLDFYALKNYKINLDIVKELENERDGGSDVFIPRHKIYFPNANDVILRMAEKSLSIIKEYFVIIDELEKNYILDSYMKICDDNASYDKNNKILKYLIESDCVFLDGQDKTAKEKYCELLKRIL